MNHSPISNTCSGNDGLSDWEQPLAEKIAAAFICERLLPPEELEDLVQEILLQWLTHRHGYREDRGAKQQTFFRSVAKNRLEDWYRERTAAKRGGRSSPLSLDETVDRHEEDARSRGDSIPEPGNVTSEVESKVERHSILEMLTPEQRRLVLAREQGYSLTEIARKMGVPRTTLNDELARIKRVLRTQGYDPNGS